MTPPTSYGRSIFPRKKQISLPFFLLSALLLWLASPGPGWSVLAWFALVPLIAGCARTPPRQAALFGFIAGLAYYLLMLYWVVISLSTYGNLPWWLCGIALVLLAAYMSLYLALFCAALSWFMKTAAPIWSGPLLWVVLDAVRGRLFTGFPWQDLGYSQFATPLLLQPADLVGHHGITFLILLTNTLCAALLLARGHKRHWRRTTIRLQTGSAALLLVAALGYAVLRLDQISGEMAEAPTHPVSLIQGNIDQNQKWLPENQQQTIDRYIDLSLDEASRHDSRLVVWPETAMPFYPTSNPLFAELLDRTVFSHGFSLLAGAPYFLDSDDGRQFYNSALLIRPDHSRAIYFKQQLVPFGEYIPLADVLPLPGPLVQSAGNFTAGRSAAPLADGNARIGVLICFESIFPDLARRQTTAGANLLINITNDAWFGRSSAAIQHLAMAVLRAVENRRSLARAANTGISCFIDPTGRISNRTHLFTAAAESRDLSLLQRPTFFARSGHLFPLLCLFLLFPPAIRRCLRRQAPLHTTPSLDSFSSCQAEQR